VNVALIGWSDVDAVARVDGIRVRIRRNAKAVRWLCDRHGEGINNPNHCEHTAALAAAPADPSKKNRTLKP
jgi:hypothetical protein